MLRGMMPTPPPVRPEPVIDYAAKLDPRRTVNDRPLPTSWFVTFGFGKPAENTYTEVAFTPEALLDREAAHAPFAEHVLDTVVRRVALDLYGDRWAFHYRPDQYATAIEQYPIRLRERVLVSSIEVYA